MLLATAPSGYRWQQQVFFMFTNIGALIGGMVIRAWFHAHRALQHCASSNDDYIFDTGSGDGQRALGMHLVSNF
jgi:hypothetical protein